MPRAADFLVVGCGVAGLRAAIELAPHGKVLVLSKAELTESATQYAQGGIAAALSDEDEIGLHFEDTLRAGDGLCNQEAVKVMVEEGPARIQELIEWGTRFDREGTRLAFGREGAHSRSRVLHAHGDSTGREISRALFARARSLPGVEFLPFVFTTDLLVEETRVVGVRYLDEQRQSAGEIRATGILLASGGLGQVYSETTNPGVATGDGVAVAYRAGAVVSDLEFVQFHPTALYLKGAPRFLLSEALRGEGGLLRTVELEHFMPRYHESGELAPRDVVSRAILTEMQRSGGEFVYLDMTALEPNFVRQRFPRIHATCLEFNLDIATDLIPVRPAAHYAMGGVATDLDARTSLASLWAAGEVACTGVHGANRLASNSLLEGLVFGARTGRSMAAAHRAGNSATKAAPSAGPSVAPSPAPRASGYPKEFATVRELMWKKAGILRSGAGLRAALAALEQMAGGMSAPATRCEHESANVRLAAELIVRAALAREESRGAHYRSDFPFKSGAEWCKHSRLAAGRPVTFE